MEITKREVIFSFVILAVMVVAGIFIGNAITKKISDSNIKYETAIQIENNEEQFRHCLNTNAGYTFVHGVLTANDVVYMDGYGPFISIHRELEEYRRHTRTRTYTDSNGKRHTKTEVYYSWDHIRWDYAENNSVNFCGVNFLSSIFPLPHSHFYKQQSAGHNKRYNYYVINSRYIGTLFGELENGSVKSSEFMENVELENAVKRFITPTSIVIGFYIIWLMLIIGLIIGFYYLDNYWLEDKKHYERDN